MNNFKAKLTALLMSASCCLVGVGAGLAATQDETIHANAATTEELTAEFTNNGQFAVAKAVANARDFSIKDGSSVVTNLPSGTLPEGYTGAVLEVKRSVKDSEDGFDYVNLDFSASKILAKDVDTIIVRMWVENFDSAKDEFRTIGRVTQTQRQYGYNADGPDLSTWCDVALTAQSIADMTDADGYLQSIDLGLRDKGVGSHLYIDSVTVKMATYQEVNLGKLGLYANSINSPASNRLYIQSAAGFGFDPAGDEKNFTCESGTGVVVNGQSISGAYFKQGKVDAGKESTKYARFYINLLGNWQELLDDSTHPDTVTVGGTFINSETKIKYIIEDTQFTWDGSSWTPVYTTHAIDGLQFSKWTASANQIYFKQANGKTFPVFTTENNVHWDTVFKWKDGIGVTLNGQELTAASVKYPSEMFISLKVAPAEGDVLRIGGTFYNESIATEYVIAESAFQWNGTTWVEYVESPEEPEVEYTIYDMGELLVHNNSTGATSNTPKAAQLYMKSSLMEELPFETWDDKFVVESGDGWKVNGNKVSTGKLVSSDAGLYVDLTEANVKVGDVVSVSGTFVHETKAVKYVIAESKFVWNGTVWGKYVDYKTYETGKLAIAANTNKTQLYLGKANGTAFEVTDGAWKEKLSFLEGSGVGLKLNDTALSTGDIKIPGTMFVGLGSIEPQKGDILTIGGTFYNENLAVKYVVGETKFEWNGSAWVAYVEYATYTVTKAGASGSSSASVLYLYTKEGDLLPKEKGDWDHKYALEAGSGKGLLLNGSAAPGGDVKLPGDFFMQLGVTVQAGDVVTIDGTYYNEAKAVKIIFDNCMLQWNGSAWVDYVPLNTYEIGQVVIGANSGASGVYFNKASGAAFEVVEGTWTEKLTFLAGSGVGVTLNDVQLAMDDIKIPGNLYVGLGKEAKVGDKLTIAGAFYNETLQVKYIIEESTFWWDGAAWSATEPIEYTTYTVTKAGVAGSSDASTLYLYTLEGDNLPKDLVKDDWANVYTFEKGGITLNGAAASYGDIKLPGDLYLALSGTINTGDVLTIDGTLYNKTTAIKITFVNCSLKWNGSAWVENVAEPDEPEIEYTTYTVTKVGVAGGSDASTLYLYVLAGDDLPKGDKLSWDHKYALVEGSGAGLLLNGKVIAGGDIKYPGDFFMQLGVTAKAGDVVTIDGTYYNEEKAVKITFVNCTLEWTGDVWVEELEAYDVISLTDLSLPAEINVAGTYDKTQNFFATSAANTTNSVALRFKFNSAKTQEDSWMFRLRGSDWQGIRFQIAWGNIYIVDADNLNTSLPSNTDHLIEIGAISTKDGNVWTYVKLDGVLKLSAVISPEQFGQFSDFATTGYTNQVSIYASDLTGATLKDANAAVTYVWSGGSYTEYAKADKPYALSSAKSNKLFIGWANDGKLYQPGEQIGVLTEGMTFTAVEVDFTMEDGAAIRLADTATESGIRFTSWMNAADLNALLGQYGIANVSYGTLILPYDYLAEGQKPNLDDFIVNENILKIESTQYEESGEYWIIRGAMKTIKEGNYDRLFAGRAYMEITFENGDVWTVYTPFDYEDNVRSVRYVAQQFIADTAEYEKVSDAKKEVVKAYAYADGIKLMDYDSYANNNMQLTAWYYPELDPSNGYDNATNIAIAQKMKDAGIKVVYLDGHHHLNLNTAVNVEKTRQIIKFFASQGLQTIAFGANSGEYAAKAFPDFSDCEGFIGFLAWDEPIAQEFDTLKLMAQSFEQTYGGTDVAFMVNLLPSYATIFNGTTNWWESSMSSLNKGDFKAYLQSYCDEVLSQVSGEKWLSLDTYPIKADKSLLANFLFDLAMLKLYSEYAGATSHAVLQSSGWNEGAMTRMPTAAEMEMQAYAAMAFGIDTISWWSYSDKRNDGQNNPTDNDEYYNAFAAANNEIAAIQKVYSAFEWKGIILGAGKNNGTNIGNWQLSEDNDYQAFAAVMGELGDYELYATDTKYLASVKTNKIDWNYLMGVMEDASGNEGYVLCNYNSHDKDRTQTITITFEANITEVVIYRNGVAGDPITVNNKTLTVDLATGEGVIILPSKLG